MSKSRARFLSELLGTTGLVKKAKSALAGADEIIDLSALPSIPNSKLTNSSITINSSATSLGGSVTLTTANVAENTNLYYTDARADARIAAADTGDLSEGSNLYYTNARADARIAAATTDDLSEGSSNLYYTDARADARVALIVDSAPGTLNTLNELAAALGDDANFSTTVTNTIAAKLPLAGGTMTGNLAGTTATFTTALDASLTVVSSDATTGIGFTDPSSSGYIHYVGSANQFYTTRALSVNGYTLASGMEFQVNGDSNFTGTISSGAITTSGDLKITAGSGQRYIEIASGTTNAKTYRIYNGISWNPDALLIYNHTDDSTVLTIEPGKLGVNRGASSLSHTLDVGGNVAISGTEIISSARNLTNIGTISSGAITSTGAISAEDDIYLTDAGTVRGKLLLNSSDRDNVELRAESLGSTMEFFTVGTRAMHIDANQKVGIGTDSPFAKSHIKDVDWSAGAPYGTVQLIEGNNVTDNNWGHLVITDTTTTNGNGGAISFATGASTALNPFSGIKGVSEGASWGGIGFYSRPQSGTATRRMTITSSGNVGIGTNDPDYQLHVAGAGDVKIEDTGAGSAHLHITSSTGGLRKSEWRLKTSGNNDEFTFDHRYTANDGSNDVVGNGTVLTLKSDANVDVANDLVANNAKLKAIAESNTQTAIDVFVYDTRKDSDGGAWRKRTQHTSWYSEASDTRRGTRKDFPCVAVIVAHAAGVTIYDGDDPDMPMWMYIFAGYSHNFSIGFSQNGAPTAVKARDGVIYTTTSGGAQDNSVNALFAHNFVSDRMYQWNISGGFGYYPLPIEGRDSGGSLAYHESKVSYDATKKLVSAYLNDVAVTVLPHAPIDADTGLPVPTIAVATDGGVSIIKDNGTVVDIVSNTIQHETPRKVKFVDDKVFWVAGNNYDNAWSSVNSTKIPTGDITTPYYSVTTANALVSKYTPKEWNVANHAGDLLIPINMQSPRTGALIELAKDEELIIGGEGSDDHGTVVKVVENLSDPESGMIAQIASDFNTGYQVGDIKLAALSDTSTTNLVSTDLLGGIGNFTDANAWNVSSGWSLSSNVATGSAVTAYLTPVSNGILTAGRRYAVTVTQSSYTSGTLYLYMGTGAPGVGNHYINLPSATGTYTYILNAYNSNFGIYGAGYTGVIDNVTVSLADSDRSVHQSGLQVFGTVNKTTVATGAELVGYYGWGSSNYLQQPYTAKLDFGAGDFCMMWWQKKDALTGSTAAVPIEFSNPDSDIDGSPSALVFEYLNRVRFYTRGTSGGWHFITEPTDLLSGHWQCYVVLRRNGIKEIWRNGKLAIRDTATDSRFVTSSSTILRVGKRSDGAGSPFDGMISLVRVTGTAPTPEQIAKMYNDEKHLFATNAKATLYGSSDAVTALAYDDNTELLHAGTSAGRSVFQGLNRVDNTTDAVGAAISASNGFIVED